MAFFSLVDNFFLLSVLIIFVLMGFLIYHFKTRISVAEQKTDTLFRLMTVITRKVSSLFDSENAPSENPGPSPPSPKSRPPSPKPKSEPEVYEPIVLTLSATEPVSIPIHRIVVSDESDSESDSDSEYPSDSDSDSDSDSESELTEELAEELEIHAESPKDSLLVAETVLELIQFAEPITEITSLEPETTTLLEPVELTEDPEVHKEKTEYSVDQLRKMNINQLKTIAIQNGICSDTTKIKKGELIQLIQKGN